jgi:hypothetical protein
MWRKFFSKKTLPLTGVPPIRRLKSYAAQSGYVYEYFYEGQRPLAGGEGGLEFVFTTSANRKTWQPVSVLLTDEALRQWEHTHVHPLSATERYAVAKMALFQAFDERATPDLMTREVRLRAADASAILDTLGL